jgi:hypothetical protein
MILRRMALAFAISVPVGWPIAVAQVVTSQNDNLRTSANLSEKQLRPSNVSAVTFGKLYSRTVDGDIFGQPLYVPSITLPGIGKRNLVFVATEHDSVYAFDSNGVSDTPLWKVSFLDAANGVGTVSPRDVHCPFIQPEIGITSTPVIDLSSGTLYVLARTKENGNFVQKLHALDITNGAEKLNGPATIQAEVSGLGTGAIDGKIRFDPLRENPRASLLLAGGQIYMTWGSSCDVGPYHGWVMAYDAHTLAQTAVLNLTPNGGEGGIWQSDAGPAADNEGNIFAVTGNGDFNDRSEGPDYGDSVVKLQLSRNNLSVLDYFTPFNEKELNAKDWDLGSQGPILLPDQRGAHPHLLIAAGKEGKLYLIDRDKMGKHQAAGDNQIVQSIKLPAAYGAAAYWNGHVFYTDYSYVTRDILLKEGTLVQRAVTNRMLAPAATPSVSADGVRNAIVWVLSTKEWNESSIDKPAVLHAYEAENIAHELYNSEQHSGRDRAGMTVRFAVPTVGDGRVFVGTRRRLDVYGLLNIRPASPK